MRTVIRGYYSLRKEVNQVTSGVTNALVWGPVLLLVYVNDLPQGIRSYMFTDDTKLMAKTGDMKVCRGT